jgi:hypothetical protein
LRASVKFILVGSFRRWRPIDRTCAACRPGCRSCSTRPRCYEALAPHSIELEIFRTRCLCLGLEKLIEVKRAAGPEGFEAVAELEEILDGLRDVDGRGGSRGGAGPG